MDNSITAIRAAALSLGACDKINGVSDWASLGRLFFTPQGQEFCEEHNFPSLEVFQQIKDDVRGLGVFVDAGSIELPRWQCVCLVGDTNATIEASGVEHAHTILLMHGASATINASNHAVVKVVNISGSEVIVNNDNTAVVKLF